MKDSYLTLAGRACREIVINRSRFLGYAAPCVSETDALSVLQELRTGHRGATHHCYAYIIGDNGGIMRYSDDGEPGGTAGLPIMEVLRGRRLVNCCVVVVRYFGGVLLGTGGLVRAYTQSCQAAVDEAGIACMELTSDDYCELPYPAWDKFRHAAEQLPVRIDRVQYGANVSFHLLVRVRDRDQVLITLNDASGRRLETLPEEETYIPWLI